MTDSANPTQPTAEPTKVHVVVYRTLPVDLTRYIKTLNPIHDRSEIVVVTNQPGDLDAARIYALVNLPEAQQLRFGYRLKTTIIVDGQPVEITSLEVFPKEEKWHSAKRSGIDQWTGRSTLRDYDMIRRPEGEITWPEGSDKRYIHEIKQIPPIKYPEDTLDQFTRKQRHDRDLRDFTELAGMQTGITSSGANAFEPLRGSNLRLRKIHDVDSSHTGGEFTNMDPPLEYKNMPEIDIDLPPGL